MNGGTLTAERAAGDTSVRSMTARAAAQPLTAAPDLAAGVANAMTVRDALDQLSGVHREALLLTSWECLSCTDAAAVVACSVSAFKVRLMRARRRLAAALRTGTAPARRIPAIGMGNTESDPEESSEQIR